ncbi:energy transducer TonB [Neisseria sp. CCUG12390]|uniref:energy transducer TonB n=1 Tax=Neisseria sp. CCUG12390 TaxID=3392035 RepID=UPI003A0FD840
MKNKLLGAMLTAALLTVAMPVAAADGTVSKYDKSIKAINHQALVAANHQALARQVVYPVSAVEDGLEGEVRVRIWVSPENRVRQVKVIRSSGHPILDNAVVEAAYRTAFQAKGRTVFDAKFIFRLGD